MTSFALIAFVGFMLGMRHATDPDHVIAVSTIVSRQRGIAKAGVIGAVWGLGHTLTIFLVGAAIILFKIVIPARLGLSMELAVGIMLVMLGVLNLTGILQRVMPRLAPHHPGRPSLSRWHLLRPLAIGIVHGLAGSAAVALLVMTAIRDPLREVAYLLIFGLGTVAGMMLITALIAAPLVYSSRRFSAWNHGMVYAAGILSLGFGLFVSYRTGIASGLFTAHPHWTPR